MNNKYKRIAADILKLAEVSINASNPWDIQIHNDNFYRRANIEAESCIGESYL